MLRELLDATGMQRLLVPIQAELCEDEDMRRVHEAQYLRLLRRISEGAGSMCADGFVDAHAAAAVKGIGTDAVSEAGLGTDCQPFVGLWHYCRALCGAAIAAADAAGSGKCAVALSLSGGRHHARPGRASGFCYVNDCAVAALRLSEATRGGHVLVCDLDAHHGDGTEATLSFCPHAHCVSVHRFGDRIFPRSGGPGTSRAAGASVGAVANLPLAAGCRDEKWVAGVSAAVRAVAEAVPLSGVVVQCGVDGLGQDPRRLLNLTHWAFRGAIADLLSLGLPTVVLGGGGYNDAASACALAHVVDVALGAPPRVPRYVPARMLPAFKGAERLRRSGIRSGLAVQATLAPEDESAVALADALSLLASAVSTSGCRVVEAGPLRAGKRHRQHASPAASRGDDWPGRASAAASGSTAPLVERGAITKPTTRGVLAPAENGARSESGRKQARTKPRLRRRAARCSVAAATSTAAPAQSPTRSASAPDDCGDFEFGGEDLAFGHPPGPRPGAAPPACPAASASSGKDLEAVKAGHPEWHGRGVEPLLA